MAYTVFRMAKLKSWGEVGGCGSHNLRQRPTPNADPTRENCVLVGSLTDNLVSVVRAKIGGQTIRKNAVLAVEFVMSASATYFRPDAPEKGGTWDAKQLEPWVEANMAWLRERYGDRVVSAVLHLDEETPHIQAVLVPLDEQGKLNARALFGGTRQTLSELQTTYAKSVHHLGIERGIEGSKARHTTVQEYYTRANSAFKELPPVTTPPATLRAEPEKPGLLASREAKEAYRLDHAAWERERAAAQRQHAKRNEEINARRDVAVSTANRHEVQAKELPALRRQYTEVKKSNSQLARKVAKLEVELAEAKAIVALFTPAEVRAGRERKVQLDAEAARQAEIARQEAEKTRRAAEIEADRKRRVQELATPPRSLSGPACTLAKHAREAIKAAGGDWHQVDWGQVTGAAAAEAIRDNGQEPAKVAADMLCLSPLLADPGEHHRMQSWLEKNAQQLQDEYRQAQRNRPRDNTPRPR